jgi:2-polyprenyl-6-hydroxyphenyl methylase/3-demethylubiquinone-9 3-methyltransferase
MNRTLETMKETDLFSKRAAEWWDESGPFRALHAMNPVRMHYMLQHIRKCFQNFPRLSLLDIGCGGGLVCEPFARLGLSVTGIDQSIEAIHTAQFHAQEQGLPIQYFNKDLKSLNDRFDVITVLEVLEHVDNPINLLQAASERLNPGGLLFFSTFNRTAFSYIAGIVLAERILRWAPVGTHHWANFLKPSELIIPLQSMGITTTDIKGINWSVINKTWTTTNSINGNYIAVGIKE